MFERELQYFVAHQNELVERHQGKVLVLKGEAVTGAYDSPFDAYLAGIAEFGAGNYMIQPCEPGPAAYTVTIASETAATR